MHFMGVIDRYQESDLVKLDILLNGQSVDAMATIVHNLKAQRVGRQLVEKLKKFIDRSVYLVLIANFVFVSVSFSGLFQSSQICYDFEQANVRDNNTSCNWIEGHCEGVVSSVLKFLEGHHVWFW